MNKEGTKKIEKVENYINDEKFETIIQPVLNKSDFISLPLNKKIPVVKKYLLIMKFLLLIMKKNFMLNQKNNK